MNTRRVTAAVVLLIVCSLSGCTPNVMLKNPQTGETAVCKGGDSYGLVGIPGRNLQYRCLDDYEKQGFQRVAAK